MPSGEGVKHWRGDDDQAVNLISLSSAETRPRACASCSNVNGMAKGKMSIHMSITHDFH